MPRFYFSDKMAEGAEVFLPDEEARHLSKVLRLKAGDSIELIDGKGRIATAELTETGKRNRARIQKISQYERRSRIYVVFGMTKGIALDFILHRCTEVGVLGFQPLFSAHSLPVSHFNEARWKKVLIEVCKQCQDPFLPELNQPMDFSTWIRNRDKNRLLLICDEKDRMARVENTASEKEIEVLIGPEGGWNEKEQAAFSEGTLLGLGENRLRAETAALTAVILAKKMAGEL